jgi:hypothetical protein
MLSKTLNYASHHAIAILALVCSLLALAGASYAAVAIPKNSVGTAQLKQGAVTPGKLSGTQFGGYVRAYVKINSAGQVQYAYPQAKLVGWQVTTSGVSGGIIEWKASTSNKCIALSTAQGYFGSRVPTNATLVGGSKAFKTGVSVQMAGPSGVSVAVIC